MDLLVVMIVIAAISTLSYIAGAKRSDAIRREEQRRAQWQRRLRGC